MAILLLNGEPEHGFAMRASSDKATAAEAQSDALAECRKRGAEFKRGECRIIDTSATNASRTP